VKPAIILIGVVCIHILHTALGIPLEGVEQLLIAAHPNS
jgi:hypothetical protein